MWGSLSLGVGGLPSPFVAAIMPDGGDPQTMTARDLMRKTSPLAPGDGVSRAAALLREEGTTALAVVDDGRPVGLVTEETVLGLLASLPAELLLSDKARTTPVESVMAPAPLVQADLPAQLTVQHLAASHLEAAVVVDSLGAYQGIVTKRDALAAVASALAPRSIGGLATPLGVHLTTGSVRSGPGDLGLLLTGASITLLYLAARLCVHGMAWLAGKAWPQVPLLSLRLAQSSDASEAYFGQLFGWRLGMTALEILIFFLLLRLGPLSSTHAAEHQVVHAIERGFPLEPEAVQRMPRVHARCGTNLIASLFVLFAGAEIVLSVITGSPRELASLWLVAGMGTVVLAMIAARRRLGPLLQFLFTTKRPSRKRVEAAIRVAEKLLQRHRAAGELRGTRPRRLWNMGLLQVAAGAVASGYAAKLVSDWLMLGLWGGL